ncbi:MAG TPA: radical SAM protein [Dehalococcoidia bacterium]|nr:radical SAM protein [Dehalococcoidia bacterium]
MINSIIYGPVASWRLGRSLGIDLLSTDGKTCSFDCIYCQLGKTLYPLAERREFVSLDRLVNQLEALGEIEADFVTFSGVGEPTLASNLAQAIEIAKSVLHLPVAVLTNSALIPKYDVRLDLTGADVVVAKVDAPEEEFFRRVNRPYGGHSIDEIIQGIKLFRENYQGKLAIQMMFIEANRHYAREMAEIAMGLSPDEVQLNTPLRPCAVKPLRQYAMAAVKEEFEGLNVVQVYEAPLREVTPLNSAETIRRRPES